MRRPRLRNASRMGWLFAFLFLVVSQARAASPFPPGLEKDVTGLVDGAKLSNGCEPGGIRIQSASITIRVECGGESGYIVLTAADDSAEDALRRTKSFVVRLTGISSDKVRTAATELAAQIAERDTGTFLSKATSIREGRTDQREGVSARQLGLLDNLRRAAVWLGMLVLLVWLGTLLLQRELQSREGKIWLAVLGVLFLVALGLRVKLGYWAPIHANQHGLAELRGLAARSDAWQGPVETDRYGVAYRQVVRAFLALPHGGAHAVFVFSVIASSLAVVALALLGAAVTGSRGVGGLAASGLATHPIHIGLAATESPFSLAGFLFLLGTAALCAAPRLTVLREQQLAWWLGMLALAASCELGVVTLAFPVAGLLLALSVLRKGSGAEGAWRWPLFVLIASMALHLDALWPLLQQTKDVRGNEFLGTLRTFRAERNALTNPDFAAFTLVPLAIGGAAVLLFRRPRVGLALALSALMLFLGGGLVNGCRTDMIRYQPNGHLLVFLAAACVALLVEQRGSTWRLGAVAAVLLLLLMPLRPAYAALKKPLLDVNAYHFVERSAGALPPSLSVISSPHRMAARNILGDFPEFVLQSAGKQVQVLPIDGPLDDLDTRKCAVWLSPACYSFTGEELAAHVPEHAKKLGEGSLRPECEPLVNRIDPTAEPFRHAEVPVPYREGEFLRVVGTPLIGLFPCR